MAPTLDEARAAFDRGAWLDAHDALSALAGGDGLEAADCERLAICAYLLGDDDSCAAALESAYNQALGDDDGAHAGRCAFWLAFSLMMRGQMAQAGGWLARAESAVAGVDCAVPGYLRIPRLLGALDHGDAAGARDLALEATEIGRRFDEPDLVAFGTLGHGQALIALGQTVAGLGRLDQAMVMATAGELGPIATGLVYCAVVVECMDLHDLRRAAEWTAALSRWCDDQPGLVPFRGQCLVHRSQVAQAAGDWRAAMASVEAACAHLADPPHPALGMAFYQEAELHRLQGAFDQADSEYREASRNGHDPMPGLALLQLASGDVTGAAGAVRRALQERGSPSLRPTLLAAAVEVLLAVPAVDEARAAADELDGIAAGSPSQAVAAMAAHAMGAVALAEGDPVDALRHLREAATAWRELQTPYQAARTSVLIATACSAVGDGTAAALELDNARRTFAELGAEPDLRRIDARRGGPPADRPLLSDREQQVLMEVAAGRTNREIAERLTISPHTVGRHIENIYAKLGVTSRAAATAWAYEHHLL